MNNRSIDIDLLKRVGFDHHTPDRYEKKNITLRGGDNAILWEDKITKHGILDPVSWEQTNYYTEEYRKDFSSKIGGSLFPGDHLLMHKNLCARQFKQFEQLLRPTTKYLEIGCSSGGILDLVLQSNIAECHAIEPNKADAQYLLKKYVDKINIINSTFETAKVPDNYYDIIASFEVLEHLVSPGDFLKKAIAKLKQGGYLHLEVPNHKDALLAVYQQPHYNSFYYHKAHIHYFTANSLQELCNQCGLKGKISGFQMYPFTNQMHWVLNGKPQGSVDIATQVIQPCEGVTAAQQAINNFYLRISEEYESLVNDYDVSDCLVFQGEKNDLC